MAISKKNISSTSQNRKHQRLKPYPWQIEAATTETSSKKWIKIKAVSVYPSKWLQSCIWTTWATSLLLTPINTLTRFFHYLINLSIILKSYTLYFKKKKLYSFGTTMKTWSFITHITFLSLFKLQSPRSRVKLVEKQFPSK